jgi:hypothetical protein
MTANGKLYNQWENDSIVMGNGRPGISWAMGLYACETIDHRRLQTIKITDHWETRGLLRGILRVTKKTTRLWKPQAKGNKCIRKTSHYRRTQSLWVNKPFEYMKIIPASHLKQGAS